MIDIISSSFRPSEYTEREPESRNSKNIRIPACAGMTIVFMIFVT